MQYKPSGSSSSSSTSRLTRLCRASVSVQWSV